MRKFASRVELLLTFCFLLIGVSIAAQETMIEVPMSHQVTNSSDIIEGKVVSKESFWDISRQNIYTVNTIEVFKVFKGNVQSTVEVITEGGEVDLIAQITTLSLELSVGDIGTFMLHDSNINFSPENTTSINKYESYSAIQGFYKYDTHENRASNPFVNINGISSQFYSRITAYTQSNFTKVKPFDIDNYINGFSQYRRDVNVISDFNPSSITAGTRSVLTINGSGFGSIQGTVSFRDANTGGSSFFTALDSQIVSWTDSQIQVEVPSRAGTGNIRVTTFFGGVNNSSSILEIPYSQINVTTSSDIAYPTQHIDQSDNGGYIWSMYTTFFL